ncbi:uncharacterized protein LOC143186270 [Calliopsis andreniformis]|uniref:uncharacterized protein LOC143186270 n=1 Tax=Calliopsis andreniformis TaxID=337506 RepID=UPI003FCD15D9
MQATTIQKSRVRNNQDNEKNDAENNENDMQINENDNKNAEIANVKKKETIRRRKSVEVVQKIFITTIDPFDVPLKWWETEHLKYAINYPPVRSRLEKVMGCHIVRLTDRKYMSLLARNFEMDHQELQRIRIEERKLAPPSIITRLMEISYKALTERIRLKKQQKLKPSEQKVF